MRIDIRNFGAVGDGVADDTAKIQAALDSAVPATNDNEIVVLERGKTYRINPAIGIKLRNEVALEMHGATLTCGFSNAPAVRARMLYTEPGAHDIDILGGVVVGSRTPHIGLQWGKGLWLDSATNVLVDGTTFRDHYFDGVGMGGNAPCVDITLRNVVSEGNRRNALTITNARRVRVLGCVLSGSLGQEPETGCDIEANLNEAVGDVVLMDCLIQGNNRTGLHIHRGHGTRPREITVMNCRFEYNGIGAAVNYNVIGNAVDGLRFVDNRIQGGPRGCSFGGTTARFVAYGNVIDVGAGKHALVLAGVQDAKVFENDLRNGVLMVIPADGVQGVYGRTLIEDGIYGIR
jgi:hypothetical protein